ncbi:hypothetical protein ABE41_002090 [Fictibacillus arsenicus]|uniref:Uncharacterized protein n=1 Tax=Fictibacillus arsenicus TaxID=255247 RepID=A0A1B1Z073_9BACL|nr:hypothetical protein ABE41_002090 [Fictibacillus arsenicus]
MWELDDVGSRWARAFHFLRLCSLWGIYARPEGFMLALGDLCSPWGIYARPGGFMLALGDLCSP